MQKTQWYGFEERKGNRQKTNVLKYMETKIKIYKMKRKGELFLIVHLTNESDTSTDPVVGVLIRR